MSTRELYNIRIHGSYYPPEESRLPRERYSKVGRAIRRLAKAGIGRVLEVGPESPKSADMMRRDLGVEKSSYLCLEVSDIAADRLAASGFQVVRTDVSEGKLPWPDNHFDTVIASEVIEHLLDPDHALEELRRVLKRSGLLILTTPNLAAWFNRLVLLTGRQPVYTETGTEWVFGRAPYLRQSRPVGHFHVYTLPAILELLRYHGFAIVDVGGDSLDECVLASRILRVLDASLSRFPTLAAGLIIAAHPNDEDQRLLAA